LYKFYDTREHRVRVTSDLLRDPLKNFTRRRDTGCPKIRPANVDADCYIVHGPPTLSVISLRPGFARSPIVSRTGAIAREHGLDFAKPGQRDVGEPVLLHSTVERDAILPK